MTQSRTQETAYKDTPEGEALYNRWLRMYPEGRGRQWSRFGAFYQWAKQEGYRNGDSVIRKDKRRPWGPDNAYVRGNGQDIDSRIARNKDFVVLWNKTVNRIRAYYGLPLF